MTQNNNSYQKRKSRSVKIMAAILAIAVGGSIFMSIIALIKLGGVKEKSKSSLMNLLLNLIDLMKNIRLKYLK